MSETTIVEKIIADPKRYLFNPSVSSLYSFLDGYMYPETQDPGSYVNSAPIPNSSPFGVWVAERLLGVSTDQYCAQSIIELMSQNASDSFTLFVDLWNEYIRQYQYLLGKSVSNNNMIASFSESDFFDLLRIIQLRPPLILLRSSVTSLRAFLDGYLYAFFNDECYQQDVCCIINSFSGWLSKSFGFQETFRWEKLLLFYYKSEEIALAHFFEHFSMYCVQINWGHPEKIYLK